MRSILFMLFTLASFTVNAQWSSNPSVNNAVCNFAGSQTLAQTTSDGAGGAICTWVDTRNGTQDIYAQHIDANGNLQWNADGIAICNAISDQFSPKLISDGSGGAIITWYDNRNGNWDIYAQRIDASGAVQWTVDGAAISTSTGNQNAQQLVSDGAGGAIIVWSDGAGGGPNADINAQRINAAGTALWSTSICNANSLQNIPQLISDGAGGAIITWEDWRNFSQADIYAQHVGSNGFVTWTFNGVPICTEPNFAAQYNTKIVSDGGTGAIISWQDNRTSSSGLNIYAQKVNATGTVQWTTDGIVVCNATGLQGFQQMIADGSGGTILTWEDRRTGGRDIYAQRINTSGAAQWTGNGIIICSDASTQSEPQLAARASGGAVIIWSDERNSFQQDIYAQGIDANGVALWTTNGVPVANESHSQSAAQLISNGTDGAIVAWQDLRTTLNYDIYSSRLFSNGTLPVRLLDFMVSNHLSIVTLQWKTDNELNNRGFEIQRSSDGINWHSIGFADANNLYPGIKDYRWEDRSPLSGKSYYRLKQIDNDGRFEYTKVLSVTRNPSTTVSIYPNPVREILYVNFGRMISIGKLQLYNNSGQLILTQPIESQSSLQVNAKHFPAGIYTLYIISHESQTAYKLMIE